ncbi:MAG: Uma2 family endonuclease [Bryobacteraceae bacterium]|jgi:Uma2 family endonuclease
MSTHPKVFLTPEEYLEIERQAEIRSEYYQGEMFAMAGGSEAHNILVDNLVVAFRLKLRGGSCRSYSRDMRVQVSATGFYTYPDLVVVCGERKFLDEKRDTLLNPNLIVEVLSPTTEAYDRGRKFSHYRALESLQEYVLVSQDRIQVECFKRQAAGQWLLTAASSLEDAVCLDSVGCTIPLTDIYEDVAAKDDQAGG